MQRTRVEVPGRSAMRAEDDPAFNDQHHLSLSYARLLGRRVAEGYGGDLVRIGFPRPVIGNSAGVLYPRPAPAKIAVHSNEGEVNARFRL